MIPVEAVEAAAKGMSAAAWEDWEQVPDPIRRLFLRDARLALEAAAPYMLADAFDAGFTSCAHEHINQQVDPSHPITRTNPFRPAL